MNPLEQALNKKAGKAGDKKVSAKGMGGPDMSDPKVRAHAKRYDEAAFGKGPNGKANKDYSNGVNVFTKKYKKANPGVTYP
jgi:hypothetical protein